MRSCYCKDPTDLGWLGNHNIFKPVYLIRIEESQLSFCRFMTYSKKHGEGKCCNVDMTSLDVAVMQGWGGAGVGYREEWLEMAGVG